MKIRIIVQVILAALVAHELYLVNPHLTWALLYFAAIKVMR